MKKTLVTAVMAFAGVAAMSGEELFVKELVFPAGADSVAKIEMASRLVPSPMQKAWQERELTAFLHFGMNTFTDREWGDGKESPYMFTPDSLDTDQWVRTLRDAGFGMVILTAKHHDGFCLWPTKTTLHSVASSPWRQGKGDVMADLRRSCDKYGMKLGVYLSPWDRNAECYGDSPRYNDMFVAQLTELLTDYGKIDEVWFDGACGEGPNGKKQEYDWLRFRETMRRLQPEAVLAITGDDVRWVGNEGGRGRETEWSVTPLVPSIYEWSDSVNSALGIDAMTKELGSRELVAKADRLYWWPSEVDVSIRPGWFFHENEKPHSPERMARIYLESVGRNSVLLLNIPPDRRGLIADSDVNALMQLRKWIDSNFTDNPISTPSKGFNAAVLAEPVDSGQRVEAFEISVLNNGVWRPVASGTTIGRKRILMFDPVKADSVRLDILSSRGTPNARITGIYNVVLPDDNAGLKAAYPALESATYAVKTTSGTHPAFFVDMKRPVTLAGFVYAPAQDERAARMFRYSVKASDNGIDWRDVPANGEFGNIKANPIPQQVLFGAPVEARYLLISGLETTGGEAAPRESEISLLTYPE